ncbi:hypothetical protein BST92_06700 [Nonlabens arenilitoris]|uniref:Secretion system C-terminal sorting domain-containing protein n=1 Tax=Nonlabens arenilitoris TaxID=1217969 RepID=A0A2S7U9M8_9FLAO|nr:hypothetical protein [Nonlabens arenilitoris]PQJ31635.1 hypothetical protein BST92_06700 [Nonlabens arenilitoris]
MRIKATFLLILMLLIISNSMTQDEAILKSDLSPFNHKFTHTAGEQINLKFNGHKTDTYDLLLSYNLGSTLISPQIENSVVSYEIPQFISNVSGIVKWHILNTAQYGSFTITPVSQTVKMETYIGPPSIIAGDTDYSMAVSIPLDSLDNVQKDGTTVLFNYNKETTRTQNSSDVENLIAYDYIYSTKKTENILFASNVDDQFSKEFTVDIKAGLPVDFTLSRKRNHPYADGNQLVTFHTSILKDRYDNIVSDGTLVTFYITNKWGAVLQTTGTTIKGIATASMIHPEKAEKWSVTAAVAGMASSNTLNMEFEQVFDDYDIQFNDGNRTITVGPLKSFMGQIIPDGVTVELIIKGKETNESYLKQSYNGRVQFKLNPDLIPNGIYTFEIISGGITRKIKNVHCE